MTDPAPQSRQTGRTAILVIHGIGEQNPYETVDQFARGFARHFQAYKPKLEPERIRHDGWTEVAVHLDFGDRPTSRGLKRLSLFEFYWAPYTEGKVSDRAVLWWLLRTALTPLRYLADNLQVLRDARYGHSRGDVVSLFLREVARMALLYVPVGLFVALIFFLLGRGTPGLATWAAGLPSAVAGLPISWWDGAVAICWIVAATLAWFIIRELWQWVRRATPATDRFAEWVWLCLALSFLAGFGALGWWIARTSSFSLADYRALVPQHTAWLLAGVVVALLLRRVLVGYLGDIVVYLTADEKAANYQARSQILHGSTKALELLLTRARSDFDQVIVAGHSLGSVIAYDTINALLSKVWARSDGDPATPVPLSRQDLTKLCGLVTFGSPLDKVYYFFREHVPSDQAVRAQILSFLHSFRRGYSGRDYGDFRLTYPDTEPSAFPTLAPDFRWLNVWAPLDPVSGPLHFYRLEPGDRERRWYWLWGAAHLAYWSDPEFYAWIAERLL
jgi:hypothetical protein